MLAALLANVQTGVNQSLLIGLGKPRKRKRPKQDWSPELQEVLDAQREIDEEIRRESVEIPPEVKEELAEETEQFFDAPQRIVKVQSIPVEIPDILPRLDELEKKLLSLDFKKPHVDTFVRELERLRLDDEEALIMIFASL